MKTAPPPPQLLWYVPWGSQEPAYAPAKVVRFARSRVDFDAAGEALTLLVLEDGQQLPTAEKIALLQARARDLLKYQGVDVYA